MDCFDLRKNWNDCQSDGLVRSVVETGRFEGILNLKGSIEVTNSKATEGRKISGG
jgi:hypothetical protein